jgi:predicted transcriptional regulator
MNYDEFFQEAQRSDLRLPQLSTEAQYQSSLDNEALFQLPLLAMVILSIARGRSKPALSELGQLVGECLERTVSGFKGSSQDIGWSANLRIRTIKALTFLERAGYANVDQHSKEVSVTPRGREISNMAQELDTPLGVALLTIERSYLNIKAERRIMEEV